jgi:transcriptional regulator with XRE-family HTH domain
MYLKCMGKMAPIFARNLKTLRVARGLTQEGLAQLTDLSWGSIARMEGGKQWFGLKTLGSLAKALEVEESALFFDPDLVPNKDLINLIPKRDLLKVIASAMEASPRKKKK